MRSVHRGANASFSFRGEEIDRLVEFISHIQSMPLNDGRAQRIADEHIRKLSLSKAQVMSLVRDNHELFDEVIRQALAKQEVVAIGYRKRQLAVFERLLSDAAYLEEKKAKHTCTTEGLWQKYFELNPWIFGYGLQYIHLSG